MWQCSLCNETVEDTFDICWYCCSRRDGTVNSDSEPDPDDPSVLNSGEVSPLESDPDATPTVAAGGPMNRRDIAALICKSLALLMFAQAAFLSITAILLIIFMFVAAPFRRWFDWSQFYAYLILSVPVFATLIVGLIYWKRSNSIASRMVSADPAPVTKLSITVQDVMIVAFSIAGVFILVDGMRDLVAMVYLAHRYNFTASEFWYDSQTWTALVQLSLAIWLVLGSRGIVSAIYWLRTAGIRDPDGGPAGNRAG
jgi:hypothetical protein